VPGGLTQVVWKIIKLEYSDARCWPAGASLNSETGFFSWTPDIRSNGPSTGVPITLTADLHASPAATRRSPPSTTRVSGPERALNTNGAPEFQSAETWNLLEGQPLRVSVFAFDPDNPDFEPRVRLTPTAAPSGPDTTAALLLTASPACRTGRIRSGNAGAHLERRAYQAGSYFVHVTADRRRRRHRHSGG